MIKQHWSEPFIGIPWITGGRNPLKGLDCWGLLCHVYKEVHGIHVEPYIVQKGYLSPPELILSDESTERIWIPVSEPRSGDGIALGNPQLNHVGVYVELGEPCILHSVRGTLSSITALKRLRSNGWSTIKFFRHVNSSPI